MARTGESITGPSRVRRPPGRGLPGGLVEAAKAGRIARYGRIVIVLIRKSLMKICIVGAGGIGGMLGVQLALAGEEVTFICRGANLQAARTGDQVDFGGWH